jgi:hypothetical protein
MSWPESDLRAVWESTSPVVVVLDPDGLIDTAEFESAGVTRRAASDMDLWRVFELEARRRSLSDSRLVIHLVSPMFRTPIDLPLVIERAARVATIRWPFEARWLPIWRELGDVEAALLTSELSRRTRLSVSDAIAHLFAVVLPQRDLSGELDAVAQLRTRYAIPPSLWAAVRPLLRGELALAVAADPPDLPVLQAAWTDWMDRGPASPVGSVLQAAPAASLALLGRGMLQPAPRRARDLPMWSAAGARDLTAAELIDGLLGRPPVEWPPKGFEDWVGVAEWWGELRAAMASRAPIPSDLASRCWSEWDRIDQAFGPWLRTSLGELMTQSRGRPATVDKIAPFLARRLRGGTERVALLVMDGMGLAQWSLVRECSGITVLDGGGVAAMAPTLTSFSRQAIFSGLPPIGFADSVMITAKERDRWRSFWVNEGLTQGEVRFENLAGATRDQVPTFGAEKVIGLAVLALDAMMHGAELLGDAQLAASIKAWCSHGFLRAFVEQATDAGFEVWVTADHGNLESLPTGKVNEGLLVEHAGRRARSYPNPTARDAARAEGIVWDPPGLPEIAPSFLFAAGRNGYISRSAQVVHGSLSIDEVIVPFVRVGP